MSVDENDEGKLHPDAPENRIKKALEEDAQGFSFSPMLNGFDLDHAKALMQSSALCYLHPSDIHNIAKNHWGMPFVEIKTQANSRAVLLGDNKDYLIVAFRGSDNWDAILDSASIWPTEESRILGEKVHGGYFEYLDARDPGNNRTLWQEVIDECGAYLQQHPNAKIFLTGHSLGGAVALLGAGRLLENKHDDSLAAVYTFGQPRVAGKAFLEKITDGLNGRYFRVINQGDKLKEYPFSEALTGFEHPENSVELSANGQVKVNGCCWQLPMLSIPEQDRPKSIITKAHEAAVCFANMHKLHHNPLSYLRNLAMAVVTKNKDEIPGHLINDLQVASAMCQKRQQTAIS